MPLWATILFLMAAAALPALFAAGWVLSLIDEHQDRVVARRVAAPPTAPDGRPGIDPTELAQFIASSPLASLAVKSARKAGFSIMRSQRGELVTDARSVSHIAAAAGVCTLGELEPLLVTDLDGYFERAFAPSRRKRQTWSVDRGFVFEMVLIRSLVDRITIEDLAKLIHRSIAKTLIEAAKAHAASPAQRST